MLLALGLVVVLVFIAIPVGVHHLATRKSSGEWIVFDKVPTPTGGAYRGGWTWLPRNPGAPVLVQVASVWSFALLGPAVLSLPIMLIGMAKEADGRTGGVGAAAIFGPTGLLLAFMIFAAGWRLYKRRDRSRRFAHGVAIWSLVHNVAVICAVIASSVAVDPGCWKDFDIHTLGLPALVYATVSFAHAFTLLAATQTHQDADDASNADEVLVDRSTGVYASTS